MQTQHAMPPSDAGTVEKRLHEASENHSMDEKKESSITETTVPSTGSATYATTTTGMHPQSLYNPYAVAAAAQYHNMIMAAQHHHQQPSLASGGSAAGGIPTMNGMALHHPHAHHAPPQQVYVNTMMQHHPVDSTGGATLGHLETRFQSLGLNGSIRSTTDDPDGDYQGEDNGDDNDDDHEYNNENDTPHDGEENGEYEGQADDEEQPVKLFVGQVRLSHVIVWLFTAQFVERAAVPFSQKSSCSALFAHR